METGLFFLLRERPGSKKILEPQIYEITSLPISALCGSPLSRFNVDERNEIGS